jgi:membrane complex biogenesis BtpA family protein
MLDRLVRRPFLIGVVHLLPTPGSPRFNGSFERVLARALDDARALSEGGCDALIVENYGDVPFYPERVPAETIACLAVCVREVIAVAGERPVGINVLRNDARAALGVCAATGASFVRVNVHAGAAVTDQGLVEGRAFETLRERARLGLRAAIFADAHVKHATPLGRETLGEAVADLVERGLADAVVVSGAATGAPPAIEDVREAARAARGAPIVIGSGLDAHNAAALLAHADGAIVGTALERDGSTGSEVDRERVTALCRLFARLARPGAPGGVR